VSRKLDGVMSEPLAIVSAGNGWMAQVSWVAVVVDSERLQHQFVDESRVVEADGQARCCL
jgi:hypothetical protein